MMRLPTPQEVESRAHEANLNMTEVCRRAGMHRSIFTRWKAGKGITYGNLEKLLAALPCEETEHANA